MARRKGSRDSKQAFREFVAEAEDLLERMREALSLLHDQETAGREAEPELVNHLFRSAHSLKGLSGMFGLDALGELAHRLEDVLDSMRMGRIHLSARTLGMLDEAVSLVASVLERLGDGGPEEADIRAIAGLIVRLEDAGRPSDPAARELDALALDSPLLRALTEYEEHRLRESVRRGRHVHAVEACFEILAFETGLGELTEALRAHGEVLSTLPAPGEAPESQIRFSILVATDLDAATLERHLDVPGAAVSALVPGRAPAVAAPVVAGATVPALGSEPPPEDAAEGIADSDSLRSISQTVRVDVAKLDALMNLVGEVVMQRTAVANIASRLQRDPATAVFGTELGKVHRSLERKVQELQAAVLEVRMVPLRQIFDKLSRVVRRMRRELGKEVRLDVRGAETELDKLIVEELVDPLVHLVRNAFDHGIEPPEERLAALKPAEGTICLSAFQRGNHVVIQVSDDGRGIDLEAVRARAERRGLVAPGETLTRREVVDLIFTPGLSTRTEITTTSGRGVGMDVVRSNLTALGGIVEVDTEAGRGAVITMTLPITLAIVQALLVEAGGQRFAIPLNSVIEVMLVEPAEIQRQGRRAVLNLRGDPLPLRWLAREFQLGEPQGPQLVEAERTAAGGEAARDPAGDDKRYVVVLGLGETRLGLVVDGLVGQHDTVIKPIRGPIAQVPGIAGATDLGEAVPVLVVDVSALADDGLRRREAS